MANITKTINRTILASHDVSDGGLITALSEMSLTSDYGAN